VSVTRRGPAGVSASSFDAAIAAFTEAVGQANVLLEDPDLLPYAVSLDPAGDAFPAAVVRPATREEVRAVVAAANVHRVPLHPISRGQQHGLGMATAVEASAVTVDLARMNAIHEYNGALGYVVIEPGVTFAQLHAYLREREAPYWISPISGPVGGSVIGNALDKGAGYTPLGFHFGNLIGLEIVLGDGRVLVTGDGALAGSKTLYTHKGGCGPMLDQLFAQSNYGIVTRAGVWLMPAPPAARGFVFSVPGYDDVTRVADVAGWLKLIGAIPSTVSIANDLFCIGVATPAPLPFPNPVDAPTEDGLPELRQRFGVGAWNVVGCVYGAPAELEARVSKLHEAFAATGPVTYLAEEQAAENKAFGYRFAIAKGVPDETETDVYNLHPNGSSLYFLPSLPFAGRYAREGMHLARGVCARHGFSYTAQFLCSPRSMRKTQPVIFDAADSDSRARAAQCFRELVDVFHEAGYLVSRPPTHYQEYVMAGLGLHAELSGAIKRVFDPNGILAPGRYGIR
jgi:4-cresol dehydrogenase (hydroxylating) flavoprotein subunit